jgi:hypothetical protein
MRMKNKKAVQAEQRAERKISLKRNVPLKAVKETILIVTEGTKTEPTYFNQFPQNELVIKVEGTGQDPLSLVKKAKFIQKLEKYDHVWCVFDRDDHVHFNDALQLAERYRFHVAYSNQAFEYWLLLHFEDHQGGYMHRSDYHEKIRSHLSSFSLRLDWKKSKIVSEAMYNVLVGVDPLYGKSREQIAIVRAQKVLHFHKNRHPSDANSSTTVHQLVELLRGK